MNNSFSVLRALVYFDLFDYPLNKEEIGLFMDTKIPPAELDLTLDELSASRLMTQHDNYYCLKNAVPLVNRRQAGNLLASAVLPKAFRISSFLYHFPFVRGVGISGSLSKNFADEKTDIDYFVITTANRLWIARTLMHLFKKLTFLFGKQHLYCMNYYVDEEALNIQEKNAFTAIEVATLIPVCGNGSMENFFMANSWIDKYYPNYIVDVESRRNSKHSWFKKSLEFLFEIFPANKLDNYLLNITTHRWKRKEQKQLLNASGRRMGLHTSKHFAKPNPEHLQRKIVELFERRCKEMMDKLNVGIEV